MPIATDEAVIRVRGQIDPSLQATATSAAAAQAFLAEEVRKAAAAYAAGSISAEQYARVLRTAQRDMRTLSSVVASGGAVIRGAESATRSAEPVIRRIGNTLASVTATSVGLRGSLGTVAGAILQFAAGNTLAVGVIAGLAGIAFAWRALTKDTREAREELKKTREEYLANFGKPLVIQAAIANATREATLALQQYNRWIVIARAGGKEGEEALRKATAAWDDYTAALMRAANAAKDLPRPERKRLELDRPVLAADEDIISARIRAAMGFPVGPQRRFGQPELGSPFAFGGGNIALEGEVQEMVQWFARAGWSLNDIANAAKGASESIKTATFSTERFGVAAINTAAAMIAAVAGGGGGIGGFLGLAGGLISFLPGGQIPGAIVGGLGAVIAAGSRNNDPAPVRIVDVTDSAASQMARARTGPDRITVYVVDKYGNPIDRVEALNRATQRDAVPRLAGAA